MGGQKVGLSRRENLGREERGESYLRARGCWICQDSLNLCITDSAIEEGLIFFHWDVCYQYNKQQAMI